jgi:hypothetical protein
VKASPALDLTKVFLKRSDRVGEIPVHGQKSFVYGAFFKSRFVWKCKLNMGVGRLLVVYLS